MTTRLRSSSSSKGLPVNYCSGFRSLNVASACDVDGMSYNCIFFFAFFLVSLSNYLDLVTVFKLCECVCV